MLIRAFQRFATLSADPLFHVRKVCAANFGDFSGVVGSEATEQVLLPKFFYLPPLHCIVYVTGQVLTLDP